VNPRARASTVVRVPTSARIVIAVAIAAAGVWLSDFVRGLVAIAHTNPARLGFEMMGIEIGLACAAVAIACMLPGRVTDRLGLRAGRLPLGAVIALALGTLGLSSAIDAALSFAAPRAIETSVATGIARGLAPVRAHDFAIAFAGTVIAPAVGEELLCRGVLQRTLARWIPPSAAIALAALAFGWLHMEWVHGFVAASIGCYLGLAAYWSDSTRPAIVAHATNNLAALLGSSGLLIFRLPREQALALGLAVAGLGLVWAWRSRPRGVAASHPGLQPGADSTDA
jgi:membrane protease YdiL (CAAX protease family)